jgi:hypothetical protein
MAQPAVLWEQTPMGIGHAKDWSAAQESGSVESVPRGLQRVASGEEGPARLAWVRVASRRAVAHEARMAHQPKTNLDSEPHALPVSAQLHKNLSGSHRRRSRNKHLF